MYLIFFNSIMHLLLKLSLARAVTTFGYRRAS